ncbi:MAG: hypothetical protein NTY75_02350 [Candidatus Shapirobacteria bacterium]|nr:hypothetical protein [Candidatus Shapirobacteria bacterium]
MTDNITKASPEQLEQAQKLLVIAGLPPEVRLECEGILTLELEPSVLELIKNLEKLISEKEAAYLEYKNTIKEALNDLQPKSQ